ncbi:hypothetical protein M2169_003733 [Streptomyces sp. MJP52]|nr:hypothetical protein [Streptomyces sp. MJP52]
MISTSLSAGTRRATASLTTWPPGGTVTARAPEKVSGRSVSGAASGVSSRRATPTEAEVMSSGCRP